MIYGLGPFELLLSICMLTYISYNCYMLWVSSKGDMEYGEEQ